MTMSAAANRRLSGRGRFSAVWLLALTVVALLVTAGARSQTPDRAELIERYEAVREAFAETWFEEPIHIRSDELDGRVTGTVYAVVPFDIGDLKTVLERTSDWCAIIFTHLNVKACVYDDRSHPPQVTVYIGQRRYQPPEEADRVDFRLELGRTGEDTVAGRLSAPRGPYGTRNMDIAMAATGLAPGESFMRLSYALEFGTIARTAMWVYFHTRGAHRVGFTVVGYDEAGEPEFVGGVHGMLERNVMRLYYGLKAHMETLEVPEAERLEARLTRGYDLTTRYPRQLLELQRSTYMNQKAREYDNQTALQAEIGSP